LDYSVIGDIYILSLVRHVILTPLLAIVKQAIRQVTNLYCFVY